MDDQDTGRTPEGPLYEGPPIHTLTIFANPFMEDKPSVDDERVQTVAPGDEAPSEGDWDTLYFLPGTHDIGRNFTLHAVCYIDSQCQLHLGDTIHTCNFRTRVTTYLEMLLCMAL